MACRRVWTLTAALALGAAGCGNSSSAEKSPDSSPAKPGTTSQPATSGSGSPAGTRVTSGQTTLSMTDFKFKPKTLSAKPGKLRVTASNEGQEPHELVLIATSKAPNALPTRGKQASEAGAVGEIPEQQPGHRATHSFKLTPGRYTYICNVPGHYKAGMYGRLTVR
jgi:uncharacterized cupredoxin-like copper-binding protein